MQVEYFYYLCKINQCRSISEAAKELYIGQAALRAILKRVEGELGFPIFRRGHNQLELTNEGEEAIALAKEIVAAFNEIKCMGHRQQPDGRTVKLLCSPSIDCALSGVLSAAMGAPGFGDLVIAETTGSEVSSKILQNEFNIALTYFQDASYSEYQAIANKYQIRVSKVFHDHLYLLVRHDNPLAANREIDRSTLRDHKFALLSHFALTNDSIASTEPIQGHNRLTIFSNVPLIKQAVLEQNMLSILSGYAIEYDNSVDKSLFRAIPLVGSPEENEMDLCLIYRETDSLSAMEQYVVDFIADYFSNLEYPPFSPEGQS